MFALRRMLVRIRQILLRGAVVVALAGAGVGVGAGAANASASTNCSRWVAEAIAAQSLGDRYWQRGLDLLNEGQNDLADQYINLSIESYDASQELFVLINRNNCQIP